LLGLDANSLRLLRSGKFDELMKKSSQFGLTVPDGLNEDLTGINGAINEMGAAWDGLKQKTKGGFYRLLLSDGSVKDGIEGITDLLTHGPDNVAIMHALGVTRGDEAEQLRKGYNDPEFTKTLTVTEKTALDFRTMTDGLRQKFQAYYGPKDAANQLASDLANALQRASATGQIAIRVSILASPAPVLTLAHVQCGITIPGTLILLASKVQLWSPALAVLLDSQNLRPLRPVYPPPIVS
jgi:hypothetical protein